MSTTPYSFRKQIDPLTMIPSYRPMLDPKFLKVYDRQIGQHPVAKLKATASRPISAKSASVSPLQRSAAPRPSSTVPRPSSTVPVNATMIKPPTPRIPRRELLHHVTDAALRTVTPVPPVRAPLVFSAIGPAHTERGWEASAILAQQIARMKADLEKAEARAQRQSAKRRKPRKFSQIQQESRKPSSPNLNQSTDSLMRWLQEGTPQQLTTAGTRSSKIVFNVTEPTRRNSAGTPASIPSGLTVQIPATSLDLADQDVSSPRRDSVGIQPVIRVVDNDWVAKPVAVSSPASYDSYSSDGAAPTTFAAPVAATVLVSPQSGSSGSYSDDYESDGVRHERPPSEEGSDHAPSPPAARPETRMYDYEDDFEDD
eukprot:TRINITY_DN14975_c0_g1_i1.p1 TRINITY_DN14975_c0_g1~~TRINITY_DN14975_c0_g1_i1.p1  ORF type:complete len:370 (+),score=46.66 TRINITY_DN14975_c0_g1_i1:56-1165(+)